MRAGTLSQLAEFQKRSVFKDEYGEQYYVWESVGAFRAAITPISALKGTREIITAGEVVNEVTHVLKMRYNRGSVMGAMPPFGVDGFGINEPNPPAVATPITPDMRVVSDEKIYRILSVVSVGNADRELEMRLAEGWEDSE